MKCLKAPFLQMLEIFGAPKIQELDEFKFNKFISQMGLGSGFGLRMHVAYITVRIDLAYKLRPKSAKRRKMGFDKIKPFKTNFQLLDWLSFLKNKYEEKM